MDFGEESKKQTHVTNGIIIQKEFPEIEIVHKRQPFSKGERSLKAPEEVISPYKMDVKVTPCFKDLVKDLDSSRAENAKHLQRCHLLDLAYVLIRLPIIEKNDLLPSWTGFNTILSNDSVAILDRFQHYSRHASSTFGMHWFTYQSALSVR